MRRVPGAQKACTLFVRLRYGGKSRKAGTKGARVRARMILPSRAAAWRACDHSTPPSLPLPVPRHGNAVAAAVSDGPGWRGRAGSVKECASTHGPRSSHVSSLTSAGRLLQGFVVQEANAEGWDWLSRNGGFVGPAKLHAKGWLGARERSERKRVFFGERVRSGYFWSSTKARSPPRLEDEARHVHPRPDDQVLEGRLAVRAVAAQGQGRFDLHPHRCASRRRARSHPPGQRLRPGRAHGVRHPASS